MMKTKIIYNQKPIEYDLHLKYICQQCGQAHWLSFRESSTKQFKIVCDCGFVFGVKPTKSIKIIYKTPKTKKETEMVKETEIEKKPEIPPSLLDQAIEILISYGFTKTEASDLLKQTYSNNPLSDITLLIKHSLESLRS